MRLRRFCFSVTLTRFIADLMFAKRFTPCTLKVKLEQRQFYHTSCSNASETLRVFGRDSPIFGAPQHFTFSLQLRIDFNG